MTTKIARNKPCPCGSGKKYKKCCLGKDQRDHASMSMTAPASVQHSVDTVAGAPGLMTPYVLAKLFEESEVFATMKRREPAKARLYWIPSRVVTLETDDIVTRLHKLGVDASRGAYLVLARSRTSAWDLSEVWQQKVAKQPSRHEEDFIGIAACELWKRYCPERPSVEMLDDWMQDGYNLMMSGHGAQACDRWSEVWETIHARLSSEMRTCDSTSLVFDGTQALFNWVQDFALELHNAAIDDTRYADTGTRLCEEVLAQFPEESELFRLNFRADLGEFCYLAGRDQQGERVLLDLIRDYPDRAAGYARLADLLAYGARRGEPPLDQERAQMLLETALARPVSDATDYDLQTRLNDLRSSREVATGEDPRSVP
jgi:hypothetical protein